MSLRGWQCRFRVRISGCLLSGRCLVCDHINCFSPGASMRSTIGLNGPGDNRLFEWPSTKVTGQNQNVGVSPPNSIPATQ